VKFKLENNPAGVVICHILEPISESEAKQIILGIEKILANGKARIILSFSAMAASGPGGADYLEKSLRSFKVLAKKMGGNIHFAVPSPIGDQILGCSPNLDHALQVVLGRSQGATQEEERLLAELDQLNLQVQKLQAENRVLSEKVRDLTEIVRQPSTDQELRAAVQHYRQLAAEVEALSPTSEKKN
jgi:hypothetical protein